MPLTLQELSDRVEIERAIAAYSQAVDTHDWDLLDEIFLPDADIDYRESVPYRGDLAYTKRWLSGMTRAGTYYHLLGLPWIKIQGDTAQVRAYIFFLINGAVGGSGTYEDQVVRTRDGWRFAKRVFTADTPSA